MYGTIKKYIEAYLVLLKVTAGNDLTVLNKVKKSLWIRLSYSFVLWTAECMLEFHFNIKKSFEYISKELLLSVTYTGGFSNSLKALKDFKNSISIIPRAAKEIE